MTVPRELDVRPDTAHGPWRPAELERWAADQLLVASGIVDNPGGGLLFGSQTIGQVRAALEEHGEDRYATLVSQLGDAEDLAVRREFDAARAKLAAVREALAQT